MAESERLLADLERKLDAGDLSEAILEQSLGIAARAAGEATSPSFPHGDAFAQLRGVFSRLADARWRDVRDRISARLHDSVAVRSTNETAFWAQLLAALAKDSTYMPRGDLADVAVGLAGEMLELPDESSLLADALLALLDAVQHQVKGAARQTYAGIVLRAACREKVGDNLHLLFEPAARWLGAAAVEPLLVLLGRELGYAAAQAKKGSDASALTLEWIRRAIDAFDEISGTDAATAALSAAAKAWDDDAMWLLAKEGFIPGHARPKARAWLRDKAARVKLIAALGEGDGRGDVARVAIEELRQLAGLPVAKAGRKPSLSLPKRLPDSVEEASDLVRRLGLGDAQLRVSAPATEQDLRAVEAKLGRDLPSELRALLLRTNGVASSSAIRARSRWELVPANELVALQEELARAIAEHGASSEALDGVLKGDIDIRTLAWPFAIGGSPGGDIFVLDDEKHRTPFSPVLRFVHDEACTCRAERTSVAALFAALALEAWNASARDFRADALLAAHPTGGRTSMRRGTRGKV